MVDDPKLSKMKDDVIDGMIGDTHGFKTIPEQPMCDQKGLLIQMVFADDNLAK